MAGREQTAKKKGPLEAFGDSNFARDTSEVYPANDSPAECGYIKRDYPSAGPASDSTEIASTKDSIGSLGNDGTSRNSYKIQPDIISAENPEPGKTGTGN